MSSLPKISQTSAEGDYDSHQGQRRRAHSETPKSRPRRQQSIFRPFCITTSLEQNLQHLNRIGKELEDVNHDLSEVIQSQKNSSFDSGKDSLCCEAGSTSSLSNSYGNKDYLYTAVRNIEMADFAYEEFLMVMADINLSYRIEEKDLVSRASCLHRESKMFKKMSTEALIKIQRTSSGDENLESKK